MLGELVVGILLGPPLLGLLHGTEGLGVLAEMGVLLMMLYIGMEIDPAELRRASIGGLLAALGGFAAPFVLCYSLVVYGAGLAPMAGVFVGVAAGVTSLATKSRILVDLQLLDTRIAHVMMAGALVADTLALVVFAAVVGVAETGVVEIGGLVQVGGLALAFFAAAAVFGETALPWLMRRIAGLERLGRTALFTAVVLVALLYAEAAELVGMHGILGAFLAGLFLRENVLGRSISQDLMHLVRDVSIGFLAPIFFVTAGFAVSLEVFQTDLGLLLGLIALATVGKVVGTALFYLPTGHGWREGTVLGLGMNGRGAVEIIIAGIALQMGLISQSVFSILVFMALATTALVPVTLRWGVAWLRERGELVRSDAERSGVLVIGAGVVARLVASAFARGETTPVTVVDSNPMHIRQAEREGLQTVLGNALDERVLAEAGAAHARHLVALTPNGEVNALVAQAARTVFAMPDVHVLRGTTDAAAHEALVGHLHATTLFGGNAALGEWAHLAEQNRVRFETVTLERDEQPDQLFRRLRSTGALPVAVRREESVEPFHGGLTLVSGDHIMTLQSEGAAESFGHFDRTVESCPVLDLDGPLAVADFVKTVARVLAPSLGMEKGAFMERMLSREAASSTVIIPGLAIPHIQVDGDGVFLLAIARCRDGIRFPGEDRPVMAAFALATSPDQRHLHLRALAAIARIAQQPDFEQRWLDAPGAEALRALMLQSGHAASSVATEGAP